MFWRNSLSTCCPTKKSWWNETLWFNLLRSTRANLWWDKCLFRLYRLDICLKIIGPVHASTGSSITPIRCINFFTHFLFLQQLVQKIKYVLDLTVILNWPLHHRVYLKMPTNVRTMKLYCGTRKRKPKSNLSRVYSQLKMKMMFTIWEWNRITVVMV